MTQAPKSLVKNWEGQMVIALADGWNEAEGTVACSLKGPGADMWKTFSFEEFEALPEWGGTIRTSHG